MPSKSAHRCLIVFAREPVQGQVKTRLAQAVSDRHILKLYKAFLRDTVELAKKVSCEERVLAYAPVASCRYLKKIGKGFLLHRQKGETLGSRMLEAVSVTTEHKNFCHAVIIGTDSPHLPVRLVNQAFRALKRSDLVLGPSEDGGFYLIGMRAVYPKVFERVVWGSHSVLSKVLSNIKCQKLSVELLDGFFDIDTPHDLEQLRIFLRKKKRCACETRKVLKTV